MATTPIERIDPPAPAEFVARYVQRSRPVILRGAIADWPAVRLWSGAYFTRRWGDRVVPVARARGGSLYAARSGVHFETIRVADYVDRLAPGAPIDLFMFFRIHEVLPELFADTVRPPYCSDVRWFRSRFWYGGPGTRSPLHRDLPENLYAQVVGRKRFLLLDRRLTRLVHRHSFFSGVPNFSPVDASAPDLARYPRFRDAPLLVADLEPGDLLYIPSFWWHQGHSDEVSMSLSQWWTRGAMVPVARAAELFMRVRGIRI